jgi:hypothetical protein
VWKVAVARVKAAAMEVTVKEEAREGAEEEVVEEVSAQARQEGGAHRGRLRWLCGRLGGYAVVVN